MLLAEALAAVAAEVDPYLAAPAVVSNLVRQAAWLPEDAAAAYLECRPGGAPERIDLLVCLVSTAEVTPVSPSGDAIAPWVHSSDAGWRLARSAQKARRTSGTALATGSPLLWLEFDDAGGSERLPSPSVCVCVEPTYLDRQRFRACDPSSMAMAMEAAKLAGLSLDDESALLRCIVGLPAGGRAIHVSFMCSRRPPVTKLYARVPVDSASQWLARCGWQGDARLVERILSWRRGREDVVHLDASIHGGEVLARLGIAFPKVERGERFDGEVFDGLAALSLDRAVARRAREACGAWSASEPPLRSGGSWPYVLHRWVDQKIVLDDGAAQLKLYLGLRPLPALIGGMATAGGR